MAGHTEEKQKKSPDVAKAKKKPYTPPKILSREKIEGRANVCDPLAGGKVTVPACGIARS